VSDFAWAMMAVIVGIVCATVCDVVRVMYQTDDDEPCDCDIGCDKCNPEHL